MYRTQLDEADADGRRPDFPPPRPEAGRLQDMPAGNTLPHRLAAGEAITRWLYTNPQVEHWQGERQPLIDAVDYRFVSADTGVSAARRKLAQRGPRPDDSLPAGPFEHLHVHSSSPNVDFSVFAYVPLMIRRALRCRLHSSGGQARFRLTVSGALRLWLGEALVAEFAPWKHNAEASREVELDLPAGAVELTVELENLHERNTATYFSVAWLSGAEAACSIPTDAPEEVEDAMRVVDGLDFDRVYYEGGPITMGLDHTPRFDLPLDVLSVDQSPRNHCHEWLDIAPFPLTLRASSRQVGLPPIETLPTGCSEVLICARVAGLRLPKRLGTTILSRATPLEGASLPARKAEALRLAAEDRGAELSVAMVHLAAGKFSDRTRRLVEQGLRLIENRHDCSDFAYLIALRIWRDYRSALPEDLTGRLKAALLGYRFWMAEPGNDAMWFWSENHILCFHISQFVAGHLFPGETFPNSGRSGADLEEAARERLYRWFEGVERFGLCEWNSAAYYPIDMLALLALHDLSPDPGLKAKAGALMDRIFVMAALHTTGGVPAGSQGRSYEKELLCGPINELAVTLAIAFGGTYYPGQGRAAFSFCLSDYAPPPEAAAFLRPAPGQRIEAQYHQGHNRHGKLTLWKTEAAQLSTVTDHFTGMLGAQQHVVDAQLAGHPMARLWINHPGDRKPWSERRPSRLAGSHWLPRVAQDGRRAFLIYDVPDDPRFIPYTQLFAVTQAFDEVAQLGQGVFLRSGSWCARVWCSAQLVEERGGAYRGALFRAETRRAAWALSLDQAATEAEAEALRAGLATLPLRFDPEALTLQFDGHGLDYATGSFTRGGQEVRQDFSAATPRVAIDGGEFRDWDAMKKV
jgi:hypothetical protein